MTKMKSTRKYQLNFRHHHHHHHIIIIINIITIPRRSVLYPCDRVDIARQWSWTQPCGRICVARAHCSDPHASHRGSVDTSEQYISSETGIFLFLSQQNYEKGANCSNDCNDNDRQSHENERSDRSKCHISSTTREYSRIDNRSVICEAMTMDLSYVKQ